VWPVGPLKNCPACGAPSDSPPCAGQLPDRLLYRAIAAFSRPDDAVLIADATASAAVQACADFDRHVLLPQQASPHDQPASLLLVPPPCPNSPPTPSPSQREHDTTTCQTQTIIQSVRLLRPGSLVVTITAPAITNDGWLDDRTGRLTTALTGLGLSYLQHIVAIHTDLRDGHLLPPDTPTTSPRHSEAGRHQRVHLDLLLTAVPGEPL
jgi:hypothetical protein